MTSNASRVLDWQKFNLGLQVQKIVVNVEADIILLSNNWSSLWGEIYSSFNISSRLLIVTNPTIKLADDVLFDLIKILGQVFDKVLELFSSIAVLIHPGVNFVVNFLLDFTSVLW